MAEAEFEAREAAHLVFEIVSLAEARAQPSAGTGSSSLPGPEQYILFSHGYELAGSGNLPLLCHVLCPPPCAGVMYMHDHTLCLILRDSSRGRQIAVSSSSLAALYIEFPASRDHVKQDKTEEGGAEFQCCWEGWAKAILLPQQQEGSVLSFLFL